MSSLSPFVPWSPPAAGGGLRLAVKDLIDVAGVPTGAGHPRWLTTHPVPERSAEVVERLVAAGYEVAGKTHTDELAYSLFGTNAHYGSPRHPRLKDRHVGGSSSGSAVAVAAGLADVGLGTDTAGSIRIPAAWCGLVGVRPTRGRVSTAGVVPLAPEFDTVGWLTRSVAEARAVAELLLPGDRTAPGPLSLWLPADVWAEADDEIAGRLAGVPAALRRAGFEPRSDDPLGVTEADAAAFSAVQGAQVWSAHGEWIDREKPLFGPGVGARIAAARSLDPARVADARTHLGGLVRDLHARLAGRVLVTPTSPIAPPLLAAPPGGDGRRRLLRSTLPASAAGLPVVTVPIGDGSPAAISLTGPPDHEPILLEIAAALGP